MSQHTRPSMTPAVNRRALLRGPLRLLVALAIAAVMIDSWVVGGLFFPAVVSGGSMAPALLGAHRQWDCTACANSFACNRESLPTAGRDAICPWCGAANECAAGYDLPGQRIWIDRTAYAWRTPQRWEAVVFRQPEEPEMLCVKRVVGLPGEVVELAAGDVVINGHVAAKQPRVQRAVSVPLAPGDLAPARWHADEDRAWRWNGERFVHESDASDKIDWLVYRHAEPMLDASSERVILDGSPSDQSESRRLNEVADFSLCFKPHSKGSGELLLRAQSRGDRFDITLEPESGDLTLVHNGREVLTAQAVDAVRRTAALELILADHRLRLVAGGQTVAQYAFQPRAGADSAAAHLAIGARGLAVEISNLRVFRDVYYTGSPRAGGQYRLGPEEYFVLGDNSAHSADSRTWRWPVSSGLLLGRALAW